MDYRNCPAPSQVTWENNQSPLIEMHIHQQNHWNDILFYWYQSYHWYQWTISLTNRIHLCILDMCVPPNPFFKGKALGTRLRKRGNEQHVFLVLPPVNVEFSREFSLCYPKLEMDSGT